MKRRNANTTAMLKRADLGWTPYRIIMPGIAGSTMLIAGLLPWLTYPTGERFLAWQLPVDIGWQLRTGVFNYGLLSLGCACYVFFIAYKAGQTLFQFKQDIEASQKTVAAAQSLARHISAAIWLCLFPSLLFLLQYLFIDMQSIAVLTRGELQLLLVKTHLGYAVAAQFFHIQSLTFQPLSFSERFGLLLDHSNIGLFLPLISVLILLSERLLASKKAVRMERGETHRRSFPLALTLASSLLVGIVLGRGPGGLACVYEAEHLLSVGSYQSALQWLDAAHLLNPSLDQLAAYHIDRGQAEYFLHPQQPNVESQVYLAAYYRQQNDLLSSYQELADARQKYPYAQWLTDEMSLSLERLSELNKPLQGQEMTLLDGDASALSWLSQLEQVDPTNIYAHYTIGRILYDMRDYSDCEIQMRSILALDTLNDIQSSAYTYIALSQIGQGNYVIGHEDLFKAQDLDPEYRNNTARQDMSGMR